MPTAEHDSRPTPSPLAVYRRTLLGRPWMFAFVAIFLMYPVSLWLGPYVSWIGPAYLLATTMVLVVLVPWWISRRK